MEVKSNEAYQAMLHEIEFVESSISAKEDAVLERMMEADDLEERATRAREVMESRAREIAQTKDKLNSFARAAEIRLREIEQERESVQNSLPEELIGQYTRISRARNGVAVAEVRVDSCQACHVRLRPQLLAEVKLNRAIHSCENCSRILYFASSS